MKIIFPQKLVTDKKGIDFLSYLWGISKKTHDTVIIWDLLRTRKIETNLLSVIGIIIERMHLRNNQVMVILKNEKDNNTPFNSEIIDRLFQGYSHAQYNALKYKLFHKDNFRSQIDTLLNRDLKDMNLRYYTELKTILSELIANIYMHTDLKEGSVAGYIIDKNEVVISIFNMGKTIRQNIRDKNDYDFSNDKEALIWALKKLNTTRGKDESGGLGLYLLRKYMHQVNGKAIISSGKSLIMLDKNSFNINKVNEINLTNSYDLESFFPGNLITLKFKFKQSEIEELELVQSINLDLI